MSVVIRASLRVRRVRQVVHVSKTRSCGVRSRDPCRARWPVRPGSAGVATVAGMAGTSTTLDWYGCATFAVHSAGLHILLDAYIDRAENAAGPSPAVSAADVEQCDYIVIGHAHFDHLYGAERVMANTNATLIGSYETLRVMENLGVPLDRMIPVAGGETVELEGAIGRATVSVYPSQHSCVWSHGQMDQPDEVCIGDLGVTYQEQRARFARAGRVHGHLARRSGDRARDGFDGRPQRPR